MKLNRDYIIPFVGLKLGLHKFKFNITDMFFDSYEYSTIHKGNVNISLVLDKKETMLIGNYIIDGIVQSECSRCNDPIDIKVFGEYQLIYKFDNHPSNDESLIIISPEEFELDISDNIFEFIMISIPLRSVHDESLCNKEMIKQLKEYILVESKDDDYLYHHSIDVAEDDIDPRWSILKGLN